MIYRTACCSTEAVLKLSSSNRHVHLSVTEIIVTDHYRSTTSGAAFSEEDLTSFIVINRYAAL